MLTQSVDVVRMPHRECSELPVQAIDLCLSLCKLLPQGCNAGWGSLPVQSDATVLVNLCSEVPSGFDNYARVIEVVSGSDLDRQQARERWKFYKANGIEPQRHDLQLASPESRKPG